MTKQSRGRTAPEWVRLLAARFEESLPIDTPLPLWYQWVACRIGLHNWLSVWDVGVCLSARCPLDGRVLSERERYVSIHVWERAEAGEGVGS